MADKIEDKNITRLAIVGSLTALVYYSQDYLSSIPEGISLGFIDVALTAVVKILPKLIFPILFLYVLVLGINYAYYDKESKVKEYSQYLSQYLFNLFIAVLSLVIIVVFSFIFNLWLLNFFPEFNSLFTQIIAATIFFIGIFLGFAIGFYLFISLGFFNPLYSKKKKVK